MATLNVDFSHSNGDKINKLKKIIIHFQFLKGRVLSNLEDVF